MPSPTVNWNLVEVRGLYVGTDGEPIKGNVVFNPRVGRFVDTAAKTTLVARAVAVKLDVNGAFTVLLPATDDPDLTPNGFTYSVKEDFAGGSVYDIEVPLASAGAGLEIALAAPAEPDAGAGQVAVTRAELTGYVSDASSSKDEAAVSAANALASEIAAAASAAAAQDHTTGFATVVANGLPAGSAPTATFTGTAPNRQLELGIPDGADGADGASADPAVTAGKVSAVDSGGAPITDAELVFTATDVEPAGLADHQVWVPPASHDSRREKVNPVGASGASLTLPSTAVASLSRITLTAPCVITMPSAAAGLSFTVVFVQDSTGSRTVTWPASVRWPGGVVPVLSTAPGSIDILEFRCADGSNWLGRVTGLGFAVKAPLVTDNFTGDAASITGRTTTTGSKTWAHSTASTVIGTLGGVVKARSGSGNSHAVFSSGVANGYVQAKLADMNGAVGSRISGLLARGHASNLSGIEAQTRSSGADTAFAIFTRDSGGTATLVASTLGQGLGLPAVNDVLRLEFNGDQVRLLVNGTQFIGWQTITLNQTSDMHGFYANNADTVTAWDDLAVDVL